METPSYTTASSPQTIPTLLSTNASEISSSPSPPPPQPVNESTPKDPPPARAVRVGKSLMKLVSRKGLRQDPLELGDQFTKITSNGKTKVKVLRVEKDSLVWASTFKRKLQRQVKLTSVVELRVGQRTPNFEKVFDKTTDNLSFSLIYTLQGEPKSLDLICRDNAQFDLWTHGLRKKILEFNNCALTGDPEMDFVRQKWKELDTNGDGQLDRKEVLKLCKTLNVQVGQRFISKKFHEFDDNGNGVLEFREFCAFLEFLRERVDIHEIYKTLCNDPEAPKEESYITSETLQRFLKEKQGEDQSLEDVRELIMSFSRVVKIDPNNNAPLSTRRGAAAPNPDQMQYHAFLRFMRHHENNIMDPEQAKVHQDLTRPLSEYFVNSSHNTYLMGDQLMSNASVEMYIRCLRNNVKTVELDLWDGSDGNPVVKHGGTASGVIRAEEVVRAIRDYAFVQNDNLHHHQLFKQGRGRDHHLLQQNLPVILSLENHLSLEQQKVMAKIFVSVLGDLLLMPDPQTHKQLKSPSELRGKVILKAKRAVAEVGRESEDAGASNNNDDDLFDDDGEDVDASAAKLQPKNDKMKEVSKVCDEWAEIVHLDGSKIKSWDHSWDHGVATSVTSFGNLKLSKFNKYVEKVVRHNTRNLTRIYPSASRDALLKSSNYDPIAFWAMGCQLVSFNVQTNDKPLRLNKALFGMTNGNCGYALKPVYLREPHPETGFFCYDQPQRDPRVTTGTLRLTIISAQQLPRTRGEVIDPFVQCELVGLPQDRKLFRTATVQQNGFNPVWNETFEWSVTAPELAFLYLEVMDWDQTTEVQCVAYFAIPVASMRQGYHHLTLIHPSGHEMQFCTLFVNVSFVLNK